MKGGTDDLSAAYRHVPTVSPNMTVVALLDPDTGKVCLVAAVGRVSHNVLHTRACMHTSIPDVYATHTCASCEVLRFTMPGFNFGLSAAVMT